MRAPRFRALFRGIRPAALTGRAVLLVQRRGWRIPRVVSRTGYALFGGLATNSPGGSPAARWDEPLVPRTPGVSAPADDSPVPGRDATAPVREAIAPIMAAPGLRPIRPALRCLLVTHALDVGGMDQMVAFLARGLPRHGVDTTVLHCRDFAVGQTGPGGRLARALAAEGVAVAKVVEEDIPGWIRAHAPDVISAHGTAGFVLDAAEALGIPFVDTLHNSMHGLLDEPGWQHEAARARRVSALVAVSDLVRRQYLDHIPGLPPDRIVTIENGVAFERLAQVDQRRARDMLGLGDEFVFLCLARHMPQKNTIGLVRAFADVAEAWPQAHLLISGEVQDPLYFAQELRLRDQSRHAARIHLRGHCPRPEVLFAAADAFVLNSFYEGGPLVSMEALCAGIPVVLSDAGAARAQLGPDGQRGHLVPNPLGDPIAVDAAAVRAARYRRHANHDALVAAMGSVIRDRTHWAGRRNRLRDESIARFHPDACLNAHARVLARAAGRIPALSAPMA
jgi:glycosyltransferase involved in cell wall biosynthesis